MYTKTNWVNNETPVNAENMNKIETALETHENAIEDKLDKPEIEGSQGQILSLGADGKLTYIDKQKTESKVLKEKKVKKVMLDSKVQKGRQVSKEQQEQKEILVQR